MEEAIKQNIKRRYPRRPFVSRIGVLFKGEYFVETTCELGEKGVMFSTDLAFSKGDQITVSFFIPQGICVITRAVVRYQQINEDGSQVGVEFTTIDFDSRRSLREFIAQRPKVIRAKT